MLKQALKTKTTQENKTNKVAEKKNRKKRNTKTCTQHIFWLWVKRLFGWEYCRSFDLGSVSQNANIFPAVWVSQSWRDSYNKYNL